MLPAPAGAPDAEWLRSCGPVPEISMIFNGFSAQSLNRHN
jgi:hypothetical protein